MLLGIGEIFDRRQCRAGVFIGIAFWGLPMGVTQGLLAMFSTPVRAGARGRVMEF